MFPTNTNLLENILHFTNRDFHYHKLADEINFLVEGRIRINERLIEKGSLFIIQKNQLTCPDFLENCKILCIKVPSVPTDKYSV